MATSPPDYDERAVYGPFHRLLSPTQDAETMGKIARSGELWGKPARAGGGEPTAKAYSGPLQGGEKGFEFFTFAPPNPRHGPMWWGARSDGLVRVEGNMAKIQVLITRIEQDIVWP